MAWMFHWGDPASSTIDWCLCRKILHQAAWTSTSTIFPQQAAFFGEIFSGWKKWKKEKWCTALLAVVSCLRQSCCAKRVVSWKGKKDREHFGQTISWMGHCNSQKQWENNFCAILSKWPVKGSCGTWVQERVEGPVLWRHSSCWDQLETDHTQSNEAMDHEI